MRLAPSTVCDISFFINRLRLIAFFLLISDGFLWNSVLSLYISKIFIFLHFFKNLRINLSGCSFGLEATVKLLTFLPQEGGLYLLLSRMITPTNIYHTINSALNKISSQLVVNGVWGGPAIRLGLQQTIHQKPAPYSLIINLPAVQVPPELAPEPFARYRQSSASPEKFVAAGVALCIPAVQASPAAINWMAPPP